MINPWEVLKPALREDEAIIREQVASGEAELSSWGNEFLTITRTEKTSRGTEMVLVAAAGKNAVKHCIEIEKAARRAGFDSIRYHTQHKGLNRLVKCLDFSLMEKVYQKDLK